MARRLAQQHDLVFLRDYMEFGWLNHVVAGTALYRAGRYSHAVATDTHALIDLPAPNERLPRSEARSRAKEQGTAIRVQHIVLARLFAQYINAVEDFGALLFAIRNRNKDGLFFQYANSETSDVANAFDQILNTKKFSLHRFLRIPPPQALRTMLSKQDLLYVETHWSDLSQSIKDIAARYREVLPHTALRRLGAFKLPDDWQDHLWVILEYAPKTRPAEPHDIHPVVGSYNKIKHRFLMVEDLERFLNATDANDQLFFTHMKITADLPLDFLNYIGGVATRAGELAAMVYTIYKPDSEPSADTGND